MTKSGNVLVSSDIAFLCALRHVNRQLSVSHFITVFRELYLAVVFESWTATAFAFSTSVGSFHVVQKRAILIVEDGDLNARLVRRRAVLRHVDVHACPATQQAARPASVEGYF